MAPTTTEQDLFRHIIVPRPVQFSIRTGNGGVRLFPRTVDLEWFVIDVLFENPKAQQGGPVRSRLLHKVIDAFETARREGRAWTLDQNARPRIARCHPCGQASEGSQPEEVYWVKGRPLCGAHFNASLKVSEGMLQVDAEEWLAPKLTPCLVIPDKACELLKEWINEQKHYESVASPMGPMKQIVDGYGLDTWKVTQVIPFEEAILNAQTEPPVDMRPKAANGTVEAVEAPPAN